MTVLALGGGTMTIEEAVEALRDIGADPAMRHDRHGREYWQHRCAHPDHHDSWPSATITTDDTGRLLLNCFSCAPPKGSSARVRWVAQVLGRLHDRTVKDPPTGVARQRGSGTGAIGTKVAHYDYVDCDGQIVARKVRFWDGRRKTFLWQRPYADGWADGLRGRPLRELPLYGLHSIAAHPGLVYVVEGEKDADRLHALGLAAVSAAGSAPTDIPDDLAALVEHPCIVIADRDLVGIALANGWAERIRAAGGTAVLAQPKVATPKADVSDHLDAGHAITELDFGPPTPVAEPESQPSEEVPQTGGRRIVLTSAASIAPKRVRWMWAGRIAVGTLALLAGREGLGKSTLTYWIVAQVTRGRLPGEDHGRPRSVLIAATEDSWAEVIVPRLIAAGADLRRVHRVEVEPAGVQGITTELSLPHDIAGVAEAAREVDASLLVLDPLMSRLSSSLDTHRDAEVRQALEPLTRVLIETGMAAVGLMHFNKGTSGDPLNMVMASKGFTAVARSVSTVIRDPDDEEGVRRLFGTPKNNLGPTDLPLLAFQVVGHPVPTDDGDCWTGKLVWCGEVEGSVEDAMARGADNGDRTATSEAADWLGDYLSEQGGEADSAAVKLAARKAGHTESALQRARKRLKIVTESVGFPRKTIWRLPPVDNPAPVVSPSRFTHGESETTEMNETTGQNVTGSRGTDYRESPEWDSSRVSRVSRVRPPARDTTGSLSDLLGSCGICHLPSVTDPCSTCRQVLPT